MRFFSRFSTCVILAGLGVMPVQAQQEMPTRMNNPGVVPGGQRQVGTINIQTTVAMGVAVDAAEAPDAQINTAQKAFYLMAQGQCKLVLETVGETCQIVNLNSNADLNRTMRSEITIRGTVTMAVKLKGNPQNP